MEEAGNYRQGLTVEAGMPMKRPRLGTWVAASLSLASILACAPVGGAGGTVVLTNEDVVIVWDKEHGIEHFVRRATFYGDQKQFGFIVPSPSVPQLALAKDEVFDLLRRQIPKPKEPFSLGCAKHAAKKAASGVRVVRTQTVGNYEATIIKATDGAALGAWLHKNGYVSPASTTQWLNSYVARKWVFTAFKFKGDLEDMARTQAIRMSFKTDRPEYPYSMPKDDWAESGRKAMNVFFLSSAPVESRYENTNEPWSGSVRWSGQLNNSVSGELSQYLGLSHENLPRTLTMTAFQSGYDAKGYANDLYFIEKPAKVVLWPWEIGAAVVALVIWRVRARPRSEASEAERAAA